MDQRALKPETDTEKRIPLGQLNPWPKHNVHPRFWKTLQVVHILNISMANNRRNKSKKAMVFITSNGDEQNLNLPRQWSLLVGNRTGKSFEIGRN